MCDERAGSAGDNTMGRLIHTLGAFYSKYQLQLPVQLSQRPTLHTESSTATVAMPALSCWRLNISKIFCFKLRLKKHKFS